MIRVACGIVLRGAQALHGLRPQGAKIPMAWELPGGKVEAGEHPEEALRREWLEELGVEVRTTGRLVGACVVTCPEPILVEVHQVADDGQDFERVQAGYDGAWHRRLEWRSPLDAVSRWPMTPGYYGCLPHILRWMGVAWA